MARNRQPVILNGEVRDARFAAAQPRPRIQSSISVPLLVGDKLVGVLDVNSTERHRPFTPGQMKALSVLASIAASVVEGTALVARTRESEEALRDSNRRLEEALSELQGAQARIVEQERLRALGQMASGIAHDFNNALGPILGYSELLLRRPEDLADHDKVLRYLQLMNTGARDAASIVSRLREFYRNRNEDEVVLPVNLNRTVEQAISLTQPRWKDQALADGRTITMETDLGAVPLVSGNESELREVLINLIFNADTRHHGHRLRPDHGGLCRTPRRR